MKLLKIVWVTTRFIAYHRWSEAKEPVAYLQHCHRHEFHVKMGVEVNHNNREVEFIGLKIELNKYIDAQFRDRYFTFSCEEIAEYILKEFGAIYVTVSEDGENGATVVDESKRIDARINYDIDLPPNHV